jgi:hypothetical protein
MEHNKQHHFSIIIRNATIARSPPYPYYIFVHPQQGIHTKMNTLCMEHIHKKQNGMSNNNNTNWTAGGRTTHGRFRGRGGADAPALSKGTTGNNDNNDNDDDSRG